MLPTVCAARSYCRTFSGAFMALVYSPDLAREIRVIRGDLRRHRPPQQRDLFRRGPRRLARASAIEIEPGALAHFLCRMTGMHALQAEAPLGLLPGEKCLAGQQGAGSAGPLYVRRAPAGSGDELDYRYPHA